MKVILLSVLLASTLTLSGALSRYDCYATGNYRMGDSTCKKYYVCNLYYGWLWYKSFSTCLYDTIFNPTTQECDSSAVCIDSYCLNQAAYANISDPNAVNATYPSTYIQCLGESNQYPEIRNCTTGLFFNSTAAECTSA